MKNAKNQNREIFVFVGQNATCGTPHPITGRMSTYGTIYRVDGSLKQAKEWAEMMELRDCNSRITAVGGRRKMREFCLGTTMMYFNQDLECAPVVHPDDEENAYNWVVA